MSNIIEIGASQKEKETASPPSALSKGRAVELATCLRKLRATHEKSIIDPGNEAEKVALTEALATGLLTHADELLGCWFAVKDEYEPLTLGLAALLRRSGNINAAIAQRSTPSPKSNE
jgi:hypothetical protein